MVLTTTQQAKKFEEALAGEELEVEVLNQTPHKQGQVSERRISAVCKIHKEDKTV